MTGPSRDVVQTDFGLWRLGVGVGHADELLAAVDPQAAHVIVECGNPSLGWHNAPVLIGNEAAPQVRRVRGLHFDLLVTGTELAALGPLMRDEHDGSLTCYQLKEKPKADFRLPDQEPARTHAMRGQGVLLHVWLPHDGESAVILSPHRPVVEAFATRLGALLERTPPVT